MGKSGLSAEWTYTGFIPADVRAKWDCADVNVSEERRTLSAAWLNAIASGAIVTGFIAPTIAVTLYLANVVLGWPLILMSLAWLAIGCAYIGWRGVCSEAATMPLLRPAPILFCRLSCSPSASGRFGSRIGTPAAIRRLDERMHGPIPDDRTLSRRRGRRGGDRLLQASVRGRRAPARARTRPDRHAR